MWQPNSVAQTVYCGQMRDGHGNYRGMASHDPNEIGDMFLPPSGPSATGITPIAENDEDEKEAEEETKEETVDEDEQARREEEMRLAEEHRRKMQREADMAKRQADLEERKRLKAEEAARKKAADEAAK